MRISDWSSDVCSSDLAVARAVEADRAVARVDVGDRATQVVAVGTAVAGAALAHVAPDFDLAPPPFAARLHGVEAAHRPEARRVGKACVSTLSSRWSRFHHKYNIT